MSERMTVFDPTGFPPVVSRKELAPRLPTLEGRTASSHL